MKGRILHLLSLRHGFLTTGNFMYNDWPGPQPDEANRLFNEVLATCSEVYPLVQHIKIDMERVDYQPMEGLLQLLAGAPNLAVVEFVEGVLIEA